MFNCLQLWVIVESEQFLKSQTSPPSSRCALSPLPPESGTTLLFSDSCFHAGFCKSSTVSVKGGYWKNEGKIRGSFAALHEVFKAVQMLTCSRERSSGKPDMFNTADSRPLSPFSLLSLHRRSNREQSSPRISQHRWVRSGIYYILNEVICWTWILMSVSRLWFSDFYIFASYNFPPSYFSPDTHRSPCIFHRIERPSDNASLLWIGFWIVVDWCFDPQLLCMLKTWRPNAEVAPVAALHCSSVCARVCVCACEWLNKKCILKSCVEQLRLKVQTNCILTFLQITQQIIDFHILLPECPLSVHPEISSSAFLFSWQLRRHYPAHRTQEELTALSHKPIQSGLSCLVSELSLWYTLCYSCPSFSLLAQISRALIQTIYHLICFYFESYLAFPPIPLQLTPALRV